PTANEISLSFSASSGYTTQQSKHEMAVRSRTPAVRALAAARPSQEMSEEDAESMAALEDLAGLDKPEMTEEKAAELEKKWRMRHRIHFRWRRVYGVVHRVYRGYRRIICGKR
ncbi:hypothetical protein BOX15_Mlig001660g1, partial [Macrostomum lignano]